MEDKATSNQNTAIPLVIDLDGTLLKTDMLVESLLYVVRHSPFDILKIPTWLFKGKAHLKQQLAVRSQFDPEFLPYNKEVLSLIEQTRSEKRPIVLATASDDSIAHNIAEYLGCFDHVLASDGNRNLSGTQKATALVEHFGENGFDYAGNSNDDLPVWQHARKAIVVNASKQTIRRAQANENTDRVINSDQSSVLDWLKALRPHQWSKNALLLLPLLASHQFGDIDNITSVLMGIFLFSLSASSAYLLNDLLDIQDDRQHPSKCHRPLAAGKISALHAAFLAILMAVVPITLSILILPLAFSVVLLSYYALTLAYSFWLKRQTAVDVVTLSMLYTLRIVAGAFAIEVPLTFWILTFSMFLFLSLALMKRFTELYQAREKGKSTKTAGRGYYPDDLEMVSSMGVSSAFLSILILALYIQDQSTTLAYSNPAILWFTCPIMLLWITRIWFLTHRGEMTDDPVLFAIKDKTSLATVAVILVTFGAAL